MSNSSDTRGLKTRSAFGPRDYLTGPLYSAPTFRLSRGTDVRSRALPWFRNSQVVALEIL